MRGLAIVGLVLGVLAARADAKGCHERSFVVAYQHCHAFGDWSRDQDWLPLAIEIGWLHRDFIDDPFTLSGGRTSAAQRLVGDGASMRILGGFERVLYTGVELQYTSLIDAPQFANTSSSTETGGILAVVGAHASLWRLTGGVELAGGYQRTTLDYCPTTASCADAIGQNAGVLEARVQATLFATPHYSLTVGYGHSLVARDNQTVFLSLGVHFIAIDGMY